MCDGGLLVLAFNFDGRRDSFVGPEDYKCCKGRVFVWIQYNFWLIEISVVGSKIFLVFRLQSNEARFSFEYVMSAE